MTNLKHGNDDARRFEGEKDISHAFAETDAGFAKFAAGVRDRPHVLAAVRFLKKSRTRVAFILASWCFAEGMYFRERPFALARPNVWVVMGLLLIAGGLALRLAALGCIRKKERLATQGVYSLCRHPLYLGSVLLAYGFCMLLADVENFVLATVYFAVFYPLTIFWEETRLAVRYGEAYQRYRVLTPMLFPLGAFRAGEFTWQAAMSRGGALLLATVVILLAGVQVMAEVVLP